MRKFPSVWIGLSLVTVFVPGALSAQSIIPAGLVDKAQKQVVDYIGKLADVRYYLFLRLVHQAHRND